MSSADLAQYSDFQSDHTSSLLENFRRLAIQKGWKKKSQVYKAERRAFLAKAVEAGFLDKFGVNINSLQAWQSLCQTIGVPESKEGEDVPQLTSISACKQGGCISATFCVFLISPRQSIGPQEHLCESCQSCRCWYSWKSHFEEIQLGKGTGQVHSQDRESLPQRESEDEPTSLHISHCNRVRGQVQVQVQVCDLN